MTYETDAIQDLDVLNPETTAESGAPTEREPSAREKMMDAIAVDREGFEDGQTANDLTPDSQLQSQLSDNLLADGLDKVRVRVKIDGVESEVTVAEMQRQYQKNGAAERRLEEATRLLNEARAQTPPVGFNKPTEVRNDEPGQQVADADQERKEFLAALYEGNEEKALEQLKKIGVGRPSEPTLDTAQLTARLASEIKQQMSYDSALEKFKENYADIVADPYLADLADRHLDAEVKAGKPFTEALEAAGKRTRDWLSSKGAATASPQPTIGRNEKLERKASIDKITALNTKATTVEEPVMSASDVINEMRKSRGLS